MSALPISRQSEKWAAAVGVMFFTSTVFIKSKLYVSKSLPVTRRHCGGSRSRFGC